MQSLLAPPRQDLTEDAVRAVLRDAEVVSWDSGIEILQADESFAPNSQQVAQGFEPAGSSLSRDLTTDQHSSGTLVLDTSLFWGVQRVRPFMLATAEVRIAGKYQKVTARFDLGIYLLDTPEYPTEHKTVDRYTVKIYDKVALLSPQRVDAFQVQIGDNVIAAITAMIQETGEFNIRLDQTKASTVHDSGYQAQPGTSRLQIVNDLLDFLGYAHISTDLDGAFVSWLIVDVLTLPSEWVYDTQDPSVAMVEYPITAHHDYFSMPNKIVFQAQDPNFGLPEEGNGQWTYLNQDSITARGRTIEEVIAVPNAVDQDTLVLLASRQASDIERGGSSLGMSVFPNPLHWGQPHRGDVFTLVDDVLAVTYQDGDYELKSWTLPLDGKNMTLNALRTIPSPIFNPETA